MSPRASDLYPAAMLLACLSSCLGGEGASPPDRPNVVLIVIESLRADSVGCYGYTRQTTPAIDGLAAEGVRFSQAVASSSWTLPSVMSLFTSLPAPDHGVTAYRKSLAPGVATLASELAAAGYRTVGYTANPCTSGKFGFSRGFDMYDDFTVTMDIGATLLDRTGSAPALQQRSTNGQITALASAWLRRREPQDGPFFLFVFYFDPHYDYLPPAPYDTAFADPAYAGDQTGRGITALDGRPLSPADKRHVRSLYDGEIRHTDAHVGLLLEALDGGRGGRDTVVAVVGDHGEEFWDHGRVAHGHSLYDELVRVPLLFRCDEVAGPGRAVDGQVSLLDVMPTVLDLCGLPVPGQCAGRSLKAALEGRELPAAPAPLLLHTEIESAVVALRTPDYKLIEHLGTGRREVYRLRKDPKEQNDLAGAATDEGARRLAALLDEWKSGARAAKREPTAELPGPRGALLDKLRTLGYAK